MTKNNARGRSAPPIRDWLFDIFVLKKKNLRGINLCKFGDITRVPNARGA